MDKKERLRLAFNYLRGCDLANTQQDVAEAMGSPRSSISIAFKEPTDNFLKRFNRAYGDIFSISWLTSGEGEMLKGSAQHINNVNIVTGEKAHDNVVGNGTTIQKNESESVIAKLTETNSKLADQIAVLSGIIDRLTK